MVSITFITNDNKVVSAPPNSNLLRVSLREQGGIPFKCGGGLCGTCRCRIEAGLQNTDVIKDKERRHLTPEDFANGYRMACQTFVNGDISVSWEPRKPGAPPPRPAARTTPATVTASAAPPAMAASTPAPAAGPEPAGAAPAAVPAPTPVPNPAQAFSSLPAEARERLLAIGPRWATDITGHRRMVLEAYTPVLAAVPREDIGCERDLAYGPHERHRLDIYRRPGTRDAPVVVFVHGGAFVRGDKDSNAEVYGNVTRYFARHGCVGVNIEYRLAPEAAYPGGAEDVGRAVAWVREHIAAYGGDPAKIILFGHSAGGAHAGAYACDPAARPAGGHGLAGLILVSSRLRADVLPGNPNAKAVRAYYGEDASLHEARSVTTHAEALDVPVFLACGEFENTYLDAYSAEFAARVGMARGRMPRLMHLPGHNHTSIVAHLDSGEESLGPALLAFVRAPA